MTVLGIDTSNYTTSAALLEGERIIQRRQLLPVKEGSKGLRQNDAVFLHCRQLPQLLLEIFKEKRSFDAAAAAVRPRPAPGSYMPCFTVGEGFASALAGSEGVPFFEFSHQEGHIAAVLLGAGRRELVYEELYALHISGGTTEILSSLPGQKGLNIEILGATADISAGQVIDRLGVLCGLPFPCGSHIEELSEGWFSGVKPKDCSSGEGCNFSGLENLAKDQLIKNGKNAAAAFVLSSVAETLLKMLGRIKKADRPVVLSGGVMSNRYIKSRLLEYHEIVEAGPEFSADNAAGIAFLAEAFSL